MAGFAGKQSIVRAFDLALIWNSKARDCDIRRVPLACGDHHAGTRIVHNDSEFRLHPTHSRFRQ